MAEQFLYQSIEIKMGIISIGDHVGKPIILVPLPVIVITVLALLTNAIFTGMVTVMTF